MHFLMFALMNCYTLLHACANTSGWSIPKVDSSRHVSGVRTAVPAKKCNDCQQSNIAVAREDPNNSHTLTPTLLVSTAKTNGCLRLQATCDATASLDSVTFMTFNFGEVTPDMNGLSSITATLECTPSGWQYTGHSDTPTNITEIACWKS
uniref:C6 domain-containing protein n=1 Tax=Ascaris lumbricoides TaxID=6252 RepID=A0A0M3HSQ9_ASCLU